MYNYIHQKQDMDTALHSLHKINTSTLTHTPYVRTYIHKWQGMLSHTCENVIEVLTFFILEAKIREDMISEALEQSGVTTKDT